MTALHYMPLSLARLCGCDLIHNQNECPICGSSQWVYLKNILDTKMYEKKDKNNGTND